MQLFIEQLLNGIATGSIYAMVTLGLALVYGIMRILHVAHAAVYTIGAYVGLLFFNLTGSLLLATIGSMAACALVGIGLYGLIVQPHPLRKLVAFNVVGSGVFVLFGALARRGAAAGLAADPVPQALLITAIVVAFAATAMTVALLLRLIESTGSASLAAAPPDGASEAH